MQLLSMQRIGWLFPVVLIACGPNDATAQVCRTPEPLRATVPTEPPAPVPYAPLGRTDVPFEEVDLGIGHLHYSDELVRLDQPPGSNRWLERLELPLSLTAESEPTAGISRGWVVREGSPPQPL